MNISLPPRLENLVQQKVDSGLYTSASEVIREALRLLNNQEHKKTEDIPQLQALIQAGYDSGDPLPLKSTDEIIAMAKKKYNH